MGWLTSKTKPKGTRKKADQIGAEYALNKHGSVLLMDDNDPSRRLVEQCFRTRKTLFNPIIDWTDEDVWGFIRQQNLPYCSLYDEGFKRLGCIGCPLSGRKNMERDFERWPRYKELYIRAFQRMIENHPGEIRVLKLAEEENHKAPCENGGVHPGMVATDTQLMDVPAEKQGAAIMEWWLWQMRPVGKRPYIMLQNGESARIEAVLNRALRYDGVRYIMPKSPPEKKDDTP